MLTTNANSGPVFLTYRKNAVLQRLMVDDMNHRPLFHFTASRGWINDPNGLVFFKGEWHLGYQALWPRSWGHAKSRDLIHWKELPLMLTPDEAGDMWSGSAAVDWHDTTGMFSTQVSWWRH